MEPPQWLEVQPHGDSSSASHRRSLIADSVFAALCTAEMEVWRSEKPHFSCSKAGTFPFFPLSKTYPDHGFPDWIFTVPTIMWVWALNQECSLRGGYVPGVSPPSPPVFLQQALNIQIAGASGNEAMHASLGPPGLSQLESRSSNAINPCNCSRKETGLQLKRELLNGAETAKRPPTRSVY